MKLNLGLVLVVFAILGYGLEGYNCKIVQFIFGDSLSDVGNNRRLSRSLAQASLPWYGIDFGNGFPNGRFSNGRTVADIIGNLSLYAISIAAMLGLYMLARSHGHLQWLRCHMT